MNPLFASLIRVAAAARQGVGWLVEFMAVIVAVFVLYIGIDIWATLGAADPDQRQIGYQMFRPPSSSEFSSFEARG